MEVLQLENVTFTYAQAETSALKNIHLHVNEGEFVVLCGPSGSGKSTLLKLIKKELSPKGQLDGNLLFCGEPLQQIDERKLVEQIAIVMQDPDYQIIFDDTMQELSFALENLGLSTHEMKKRIAELVHYFSAHSLLEQKPSLMSGGQKQTLNLLSALLLKPKLLLLDEPTAQLDPIAAKKFIAMLKQLNEETGMTIVMIEHQTDELFEVADKLVLFDKGRILFEGSPQSVANQLLLAKDNYYTYVPETVRYLFEQQLLQANSIPFNLKESRQLLYQLDRNYKVTEERQIHGVTVIECCGMYSQYEKNQPFILKNLSTTIYQNEIFALLGGNGSGKTTWLKALMGSTPIVRGKIKLFNKSNMKNKELMEHIRYLPQNPKMYFSHDSIEEEMHALVKQFNANPVIVNELCETFHIEHLRNRHPQDCSGGELQRAAIACLQIGSPKILLLDEPTKGLDPIHKQQLVNILKDLQKRMTIICVTHDVQFAAQCANRCGILFNGEVTTSGTVESILKNNFFYTTALNRLTKTDSFEGFLTIEEARISSYEIISK